MDRESLAKKTANLPLPVMWALAYKRNIDYMDKQQVIQEFKKIRPRTTNHQIKHQKNEGKITYAEIAYKEQNATDETA